MFQRLLSAIIGAFLLSAGTNVRGQTTQTSDGRIIFETGEATLAGGSVRAERDVILKAAGDSITWRYKPTRWGMYDVALSLRNDAMGELEVEVAGNVLKILNPKSEAPLGRVYVAKAEPFSLTVRSGSDREIAFSGFTLIPAPEGAALVQTNDKIVLEAKNAITHSVMLRYEPATNKNCLGYWVNPNDTAEWKFSVTKPGDYEIELWQGCGKGQGGSDVLIEVRDGTGVLKEARFVVEETGHFQIFIPRKLGQVRFAEAGDYSFWIKPQRKQASAIMDIRQVVLHPADNPQARNPAIDELTKSKRVAFLGDSITYAGEYVEFVETYVRLLYPESPVEMIDLGLPSETVSGLSEPGHAGGSFPRPDLHERLGRVLETVEPDLIFACYGMNDGIYYPFSDDRFAKFQTGMVRLRERAAAAGAKVIHLTPPTFDPVPLKGRTLPPGLPEYRSPYEGYNEVLDRYSAWLVQQRERGWEVIDIHEPMNQFLQKQRSRDPKFLLAGDGVHANSQGHWLIAREILRYLGASEEIIDAEDAARLLEIKPHGREVLKLVQERQRLLKDSWLTAVGHLRPGMNQGKPLPEAEKKAVEIGELIKSLAPIPQ